MRDDLADRLATSLSREPETPRGRTHGRSDRRVPCRYHLQRIEDTFAHEPVAGSGITGTATVFAGRLRARMRRSI
jgi:hypothetical protein